jgi:DNA-binding PadR family transcriptional regulator
MRRARPLTELEGTVLGVVWSRQPCTAYQVRREFTDSPSPYWSGSAGAIYPLMARLQAAGLLRSQAHATGARKSRRYTLTAAGRAALARWVGPPVPDHIVGVPPDPLRARITFMRVLPAARRRVFLRAIEAGMQKFLELAEQEYARGGYGGPDFEPMARGALAMQKARLEWFRSVVLARERAGPARNAGKRPQRR